MEHTFDGPVLGGSTDAAGEGGDKVDAGAAGQAAVDDVVVKTSEQSVITGFDYIIINDCLEPHEHLPPRRHLAAASVEPPCHIKQQHQQSLLVTFSSSIRRSLSRASRHTARCIMRSQNDITITKTCQLLMASSGQFQTVTSAKYDYLTCFKASNTVR